jgi:ABC-type multidrug transport system fused ATPase/permease subunit
MLSAGIADHGKELGKKSIEILSTIPLVKAYGTEDLEKRHYARISDEKAKLDFQSNSLKHVMLPLQESITLISAVALFAAMLFLLVQDKGAAAAPSFIVYFYLVLNASNKFGTLSALSGMLASADAPLDELLLIMNDDDKFYVSGGKKAFEGLQKAIVLRNLTFSYRCSAIFPWIFREER